MSAIREEWTTEDGSIRLLLGDCLEILPRIGKVDAVAVVSDPPYGIAYVAAESTQRGIQAFGAIIGDSNQFDPSPWIGFDDCILWGCNNYCESIPSRLGQWYFWDKVTKNSLGVRIAEGEFAWHKNGTKPRAFRHLWSGAYRASEAGERADHPTQKPIALMDWCVRMVSQKTILDPFMGSGTTGVACIRLNRRFVGIEKETKYFEIAKKRIQNELAKTALIETPKKLVQTSFMGV